MRVVVQRVSEAKVEIEGKAIGEIGKGLVVLAGIATGDGDSQVMWMADKLSNLRIFEDGEGKMNLSVKDVAGAILLISNFTVCGDASKGRRPSFDSAAKFSEGEKVFELLLNELRNTGVKTETGEFGGDMQVSLVNDGPVTLVVEI